MKTLICTFILCHLNYALMAQQSEDAITGYWLNNEKTAEIEIYEQDGRYFGKIYRIITPEIDASKIEKQGRDLSEKEIQDKIDKEVNAMLGTIILKDLSYKKGQWSDGILYVPKKNKELNCSLSISEDHNTLNIKVSKGWLSKTVQWTRVSN